MGSIPLALQLEICLYSSTWWKDDHTGSCEWTIRGIMNIRVKICTQRELCPGGTCSSQKSDGQQHWLLHLCMCSGKPATRKTEP